MQNRNYKTPPSKADLANEVKKWIEKEVSTPQKAQKFLQRIGVHTKEGKLTENYKS